MNPPPRAPDPDIQALPACTSPGCGGVLGALRVHEGSSNLASRGKIVQTCRKCFHSYHHTPAYVYEDARHLINRITARTAGVRPSDAAANAPLRFAPVRRAEPPPGPFSCHVPGCSKKDGNPKQGARNCIDYQCKTCCINSRIDAVQNGMYRDACRAHGVDGFDPPVAAAPPLQPAVPLPPPPAPPNAQPIPVPAPAPGPNLAPAVHHVHAGRGGHGGRGRGGAPAAPGRAKPLAQPMSITWVNQRDGAIKQQHAPDPKAERQRLEKIAQQTFPFVIYHKAGSAPLRLSHSVSTYPHVQLSTTSLLEELDMTATSWFDFYNYTDGEWQTIQASAVFTVDKSRPTIIRLRPSLRTELPIADCPGLDDLLSRPASSSVPAKRQLTDLVSPPKKVPRNDSTPTISQSKARVEVIEISDTPPPSPALPHAPASSYLLPSDVRNKAWPQSFFACEHAEAWQKYKLLQDQRGVNKVSIRGEWAELFPGSEWKKTRVTEYRRIWHEAPAVIRDRCIAAGKTEAGTWAFLVSAVKAHNQGRPILWPAPAVKSEPPADSIAVSRAPPPPNLAPDPLEAEALPAPAPADPATPALIFPPSVDYVFALPQLPDMNLPPAPEFCGFCDEVIAIRPSPKLDQIYEEISSKSSLQNASGLLAPLPSCISSAYCKQHRIDSRILPAARLAQWPERIDYSNLSARVQDLVPVLEPVLDELMGGDFFLNVVAGMFRRETGYFGNLGYHAISDAVHYHFRNVPRSIHEPLEFGQFIEQVLVPEVIVTLISEDLGIDYEAAVETLHASNEFGTFYHSDIRDRSRNRPVNDTPDAQLGHTTSLILPPTTVAPPNPSQNVIPDAPATPRAPPPDAASPSLSAQHSITPAATTPKPRPSQESTEFPALPPLLSSQDLSPPLLLTAAVWDDEDDDPQVEPIDPALLCPYCDERLPVIQSETLIAMGQKLAKLSWPDPSRANPGHRAIPRITMTVSHCRRHQFESAHLPKGMAAGWLLHPNFGGLFRRILSLLRELQALVRNFTESAFWNIAFNFYEGQTVRLQGVGQQFNNSARLAQIGAGYYGERGYQIFYQAIRYMFPDSPEFVIPALTYNIVLCEVLIPEAVARIIQADLGLCTPEQARPIIKESYEFGLMLHPVDDDCPFLADAMQFIMEKNHGTHSREASQMQFPSLEQLSAQRG